MIHGTLLKRRCRRSLRLGLSAGALQKGQLPLVIPTSDALNWVSTILG
jgi:hypothetical protein